ncbi:hypothetical protein K1719_047105 [Acacia pycnantha]|nr:hypothetical protein K1719_047105 [Acacia pycnantha]
MKLYRRNRARSLLYCAQMNLSGVLREERRRKEEEIGEQREGERSSHHHLLRRRYPPSSQLESVSLRHHLIIVDFSHSFITVSATTVILFPSSITALFRRESQATIIAFSILITTFPSIFLGSHHSLFPDSPVFIPSPKPTASTSLSPLNSPIHSYFLGKFKEIAYHTDRRGN